MRYLLGITLFLVFWTSSSFAECYLRVEKPGSYDPELINENAVAHISNFVELVKPLPPGGISASEQCFYNINIVENSSGIIVTVRGTQINGSGDSKLRGLDGFQQAILRAIAKAKPDQLNRMCNAYPTLMKDNCTGRHTGADYTLITKKLNSNPVASKRYKMALIFKKRGKMDKTRMFFGEILKKYPDSLEAAFVQMHMMTEDLQQKLGNKQLDLNLLNSIQAINPAYKSTTMYSELKVNAIKWLLALVREAKSKSRFDGDLYNGVQAYLNQNVKTKLSQSLRNESIDWMVSLGELELPKENGEASAVLYFDNAVKLGISDKEAKVLNEKIKAAGIRALMRKGLMDEAEMAIVEWEVDDPDSSILIKLKKEYDRPENMVTIPAGKIRHRWVESFNLDKYEVTNSEFLEFVKANPQFEKGKVSTDLNDKDYLKRWSRNNSFSSKIRNIPVVFVSQIIATEYCKWKGKRLPTDLEWGLAAGEGLRNYPWGNKVPSKDIANFAKGLLGAPLPGDSHPLGATPEGVMHMAGNVWEWTSTMKGRKVISRGGCYYDQAEILHNENKTLTTDLPTYSSRFTGFRCAK
jgi:formylglycine-generating enzyme required for sulfatase activity